MRSEAERKNDQLIFIGPTRAGTSSVFQALSDLGAFSPSIVKETNFYLRPSWMASELDRMFRPRAGSLYTLESSPLYFVQGAIVASRIADGGNARVVAILREPVERLYSLYHHALAKRKGSKDLSPRDFVNRSIAKISCAPTGTAEDSMDRGVQEGHYVELLEQWAAALGRERIYVMFFEELVSRPGSEIARLCAWLGLPPDDIVRLELGHTNKGQVVKRMGVHRLAMRLNVLLEPFFNAVPVVRDGAKSLYYRWNPMQGRVSDKRVFSDMVEAHYKASNRGLSELLSTFQCGAIPQWVKHYE